MVNPRCIWQQKKRKDILNFNFFRLLKNKNKKDIRISNVSFALQSHSLMKWRQTSAFPAPFLARDYYVLSRSSGEYANLCLEFNPHKRSRDKTLIAKEIGMKIAQFMGRWI